MMTVETTTEQWALEYAQERLKDWAQWLANLPGVQLNSMTHAPYIEERASGKFGDRTLDDFAIDQTEEVERLMCQLARYAPALHQALIQWYLRDIGQKMAADACRCSVAEYKNRRQRGECFIAGGLLKKNP